MENKKSKGQAVKEVMSELAFQTHLRRLAKERERRLGTKRKEACTGGAAQTSNALNAIKTQSNDNTDWGVCQGGSVHD